jgi:hypothetical protein
MDLFVTTAFGVLTASVVFHFFSMSLDKNRDIFPLSKFYEAAFLFFIRLVWIPLSITTYIIYFGVTSSLLLASLYISIAVLILNSFRTFHRVLLQFKKAVLRVRMKGRIYIQSTINLKVALDNFKQRCQSYKDVVDWSKCKKRSSSLTYLNVERAIVKSRLVNGESSPRTKQRDSHSEEEKTTVKGEERFEDLQLAPNLAAEIILELYLRARNDHESWLSEYEKCRETVQTAYQMAAEAHRQLQETDAENDKADLEIFRQLESTKPDSLEMLRYLAQQTNCSLSLAERLVFTWTVELYPGDFVAQDQEDTVVLFESMKDPISVKNRLKMLFTSVRNTINERLHPQQDKGISSTLLRSVHVNHQVIFS